MIEKVVKSYPSGRFWIKADACDIKKGLWESVRHKWSGECDLGDGALQVLYKSYLKEEILQAKLVFQREGKIFVRILESCCWFLQQMKYFC